MQSLRSSCLALACLALAPALARAEVLVVASNSPYAGVFGSVQAAIDAAQDGDTVLVYAGSYPGFAVLGRALSIVAAPGETVVITGSVSVELTPIRRASVLAGLDVTGDPQNGFGLRVRSNPGFVRIQDCSFRGRDGIEQTTSFGDGEGAEGAIVESSAGVSFARCAFTGGQPPYSPDCCDWGHTGGHGLWATTTPVALYDCTLVGGRGGNGGWGGRGGDGLALVSYGAFASNSGFVGGKGGNGDDYIWGPGGDGGNGISVASAAQVRLLDTTQQGGLGGAALLIGSQGANGLPIAGGGVIAQLAGQARSLTGPTVVAEQGSVTLTLAGEPGDRVFLPSSILPGFTYKPGLKGVSLLAGMPPMTKQPLAIVPSTGSVTFTIQADALPRSEATRVRHTQAYVLPASSGAFLATPLDLVVFDCGVSGDCNQNGVPDLCDLASGTSSDCDSNGVPDECDIAAGVLPDCNGNGIADACDIASGTSTDCDGDGRPDECDYDCNQNGVPDACDVSSGASADCDANGVPDECDLDCNANGVPDACDIAAGTSLDLNGNGVPDECQSASDVYFVSPAAPPYGDGSLTKPFDTISEAIAYSIDGNQVVLLDGVYSGPANREMALGGRDIIVRGLHGAANAIIDCQGAGRAFLFVQGEPPTAGLTGLTIRNGSAASSPAEPQYGGAVLVRGASPTFVNCRFEGCEATSHGGAVSVSGSAHPTLDQCTLIDNRSGFGGAIALGTPTAQAPASLVLEGCTLSGNDAYQGSAIFFGGLDLLVRGTSMEHNTGSGSTVRAHHGTVSLESTRIVDSVGTGLSLFTPGPIELVACRFQGNSIGAAFVQGLGGTTTVRVDQCLFDANSGGAAGALWVAQCQSVSITNTTSVHGQGSVAASYYFVATPAATLANSIVWDDLGGVWPPIQIFASTLSVSHSLVRGGQSAIAVGLSSTLNWGAGNLDVDPGFVSEQGADGDPTTWADNVLALAPGSPCIDAGDNAALESDLADLDGDGDFGEPVPLDLALQPRRVDDPLTPDTGSGTAPVVDLGAYEHQP